MGLKSKIIQKAGKTTSTGITKLWKAYKEKYKNKQKELNKKIKKSDKEEVIERLKKERDEMTEPTRSHPKNAPDNYERRQKYNKKPEGKETKVISNEDSAEVIKKVNHAKQARRAQNEAISKEARQKRENKDKQLNRNKRSAQRRSARDATKDRIKKDQEMKKNALKSIKNGK